jgi:O-antigen ligase
MQYLELQYTDMFSPIVIFRGQRALLWIGPIVSLLVSPWTNYDPISVVKALAMTTMAFFLLGILLTQPDYVRAKAQKHVSLAVGLFLIFMTSTFMFSGAPLSQQFWGSFGRNTGFLTYLALVIILFSAYILSDLELIKKLSWSILLTAIPATAYALVQIQGKDPIKWSELRAFATFGNINFLSAFMGIAAVVGTIVALKSKVSLITRFLLLVLALTDLIIIQTTGSIQGMVIYVAGMGLFIFILIATNRRWRLLSIPYIAAALAAIYFGVLGLVNKGPLASFLFQPSNSFRGDYMHAGWAMTLKKPFFGVGMDSYGDWYREMRGVISTNRTTPDRISNSAHNIYLDISSYGGLPLFLVFISMSLLVIFGFLKYTLREKENLDPYVLAMFCGWVAYQIQALISINQIAVGIWGWIFSGALLGLLREQTQPTESREKKSSKNEDFISPLLMHKKFKGQLMPAKIAMQVFACSAIGFVLAFFPTYADSKYFNVSQSGDVNSMVAATRFPGTSLFHITLTADRLRNMGVNEEAKALLTLLTQRYPRDFYAWRVIAYTDLFPPEERQRALQILKELDPYNATL